MKKKELDHSKYKDWIDPNEVVPYERNAKKHPEKQVEQIAKSIHKYGWQQDTVITADNVLVIGHGRRLAALKLGCEMPYHRIDKVADEVTEEDIRALRIVDNYTNTESGYDFSMLGLELEEIDLADFEFNIPDFSNVLDVSDEDFISGTEVTKDKHKTVTCPHCGEEFDI